MRALSGDTDRAEFWQSVGAALAAFARQPGHSLRESPLPELREAALDWEDGHALQDEAEEG